MLTRISPSTGAGSPEVVGFHDPETGSCQYLVIDPATRAAALIDIVMDFDPVACRTSYASAEWALGLVAAQGADLRLILDTHPHADHLSAGDWLRGRTGAPLWSGAKVREIAALWEGFYNAPGMFDPDADFDRLLEDGETFRLGDLEVRVMLSPGHTLGSVSFVIGDAAFVHDTFMQPDSGTSRADFPGGSAAALHDSLMAILALPDDTRLFIGHDYGTAERTEPAWESTVAEQRALNTHLGGGVGREAFIARREARDATLKLPRRMLHALQVNLRGGKLPVDADGRSFFKLPANLF
ncbi:MBL fold metallo-hydrolase [Falsirhodobacter sp. 20TX0035]|uniref:MBL fold metallo-hydrolase n=1 Tax=Falsirhodobacter sp. 20TX0035 TaxID=3022019 RepID=UPI00232A8555|nr:MBL fold metallo-hydrolase [Falsirhodobacter sp. 20TX0035]MDB6452839.1 MBL fold metallo-hydrolase [Falsirhodobacter sp. 20TX0035]